MSVCLNYRGRHFCLEAWTIALACIFILGALALGLSMRPVSTPTASEFVQVSEAPLEVAPITPEVTIPKSMEPLGFVEERHMDDELVLTAVTVGGSERVVEAQHMGAAVEDDLRMENPDIAASYGLLWPY